MVTTSEQLGCVKAATTILGDKWTPLLLRYFINENEVRFCQLQDLAGGINPRTLSARLDYLEEKNIIEKVTRENNAHCTYKLTEKGNDLLPILTSMHAWGRKYSEKS
jgi:DNA-binding HxlR family transcriptional regulator